MTTCSTVHIDSTPHRSAVVARCASRTGLLKGPELTNIRPSFIFYYPVWRMRLSRYSIAARMGLKRRKAAAALVQIRRARYLVESWILEKLECGFFSTP